MENIALSPEQEAAIVNSIKKHKPYLLRLEEEVQVVQHGSIEVRLEVRNGSVEKITFLDHKTWIREKEQILDPKS